MSDETAREERDWEEACRREDAIRALLNGRTSTLAAKEVEEVAVELGLSRATLYRMIRLHRAGGTISALSRTQNEPDLYKRMENACSGRESIRFDAVKIKLLADAHPTFSYLQQIRDSSPFWSRHFQQRRSKTASVAPFRTT
jgi:putative transposase